MKMLKNRKRLNNKGFTLIELLAVVVILAIVMVISATSILNSINQSRISTLLSTAQNAANQLNTWAGEDALITTSTTMHIGTGSSFYQNVVSGVPEGSGIKAGTGAGNWVCLNDSLTVNNGGSSISILKALGLNATDLNISTTVPVQGSAKRTSCSAVRYNTALGAYEIFLSAGTEGKFYVAGEGDSKNFAYSRASKTAEQISD